MQSKGKLGSILAGVIAIFLILVCAFYLSFTFVNSSYESKAEEYAKNASKNAANADEAYNDAYKQYMDSVGEEKVYLGYTLNEVRKWGVNLGLDLKGGMNVTLQVDMPDMMRQLASTKNDSLLEKAIANTDSYLKDPAHRDEDYVKTFIAEYRKVSPDADLAVVFGPTVKSNNDATAVTQITDAINDVVETSATQTLRKRIDQFGVVSPNIQVLEGKTGQILLELPGVKDHQRVRELLQRSANLEFYLTYRYGEVAGDLANVLAAARRDSVPEAAILAKVLGSNNSSPEYVIAGYAPTTKDTKAVDSLMAHYKSLLPPDLKLAWGVKPEVRTDGQGENAKETKLGYALYTLRTSDGGPVLDGEVVTDASSDFDQQGFKGQEVSMTMNSDGAREWARITDANKGKAIAITLDGQVYSAPNVNDKIEGGRSSITGNFTVEEAKDLANVLKAGKMKAKVNVISDMVIGPSLGKQAIYDGMMSFVAALVLLMIFMCAFYGVIPGMIANLCLIFNLFFTFGILASFQAVLTLSGIAGIVLSLGMAVDANVLIFERAKEELRAGKNARNAIADGYSNAFSAIFDSNLTSIITGVILLFFGTGPIKGFATTLIIGIICSFFTAVYLSRLFFIWGANSKVFQNLTFSTVLSRKMFTSAKINFLGQRKVSFSVVVLLVALFIVSLFVKSLNPGIDFSGGRNYVVKFEKPVDPVQVKDALSPLFDGKVSVITIESSNQVRISTNYKIDEDNSSVDNEITDKLYEGLTKGGFIDAKMSKQDFSTYDASKGIVSSQKVGPTVADDMKADAYIAVSLALLAMFLYILVRFRNVAFSLGALAAVAFTAFSIIGFYSIFWGILPFAMEIDQTFIAAILTVIGYQINDTVVVFDRVRENIGLYPKQDFFTTINKSLNSTLGRTIMTSASTLLVLICIFVLGGDAIRSFVFAMILGVIIGTLATIYVASPVAYLADKARNKKAAK